MFALSDIALTNKYLVSVIPSPILIVAVLVDWVPNPDSSPVKVIYGVHVAPANSVLLVDK